MDAETIQPWGTTPGQVTSCGQLGLLIPRHRSTSFSERNLRTSLTLVAPPLLWGGLGVTVRRGRRAAQRPRPGKSPWLQRSLPNADGLWGSISWAQKGNYLIHRPVSRRPPLRGEGDSISKNPGFSGFSRCPAMNESCRLLVPRSRREGH